ncbi:inositol polyphosphate 1-phosphatase-PA [Capsaspora owczarzaki ATCC 30864]|uniref:inositol-1,4-bisphosphate 1-phosphatase n=1 Tax=Capsaspora owczarzaki (strain ATCC 30864) TaxID=595528 RepID=A0A0D2WSN1_CAPO3|nr:inositol polyphosphate 1-phosphatase-PA [Capsaspora owczarzaki ATCC 30864]KJE95240.1 inositol polyphosphate 1-phosphatase-PA [Capsaspora owczarzaki ATCC 30864]|eukprot:XP_004346391.1 inositol polyphosphate 1-phosphatase-PA [Capsaspora owczarzaki ATCC 30864]
MSARDFVTALLVAAERAARLARECRANASLFALLIEEKKADAANKRFAQDFKTLADVLIQEAVRHELALTFPAIKEHVQGEENNTFTNTLGEKVVLEVQATQEATQALLLRVLDGNVDAAAALASIVHQKIELSDFDVDGLLAQSFAASHAGAAFETATIDASTLGIWIDPIDGTNEYIRGALVEPQGGIFSEGLPTSVVLIGAFERASGLPVAGAMCQPFYPAPGTSITAGKFVSRHLWGICTASVTASNAKELIAQNHRLHRSHTADGSLVPVVTMSGSESDAIKAVAASRGIQIRATSGAGYKMLTVVEGVADAYFLSKGSTYKWDSCAPHAILRSLGRQGAVFRRPAAAAPTEAREVLYQAMDNPAIHSWANSDGVLAADSRAAHDTYAFFWSV